MTEGAARPLVSDVLDFSQRGRVVARTGKVEIGQGIALALRAVVAGALDVPVDRVALRAGDTRVSPDEGYTAGSMSVEQGGTALRAACAAARALAGGRDYWDAAATGAFDAAIADHAGAHGPAQADPAALADAGAASIRDRLRGGLFIHDLVLPGMVHARVVTAPHPQARLRSLDEAALAAMPGVRAVHVDGAFAAILADTEAEAAAAVARADTLAHWDVPAGGPDTDAEALASATETEVLTETGPATAGNRKVVAEFARPFLAHASIGTCCALALQDDDGRLSVWSHAQGPHQLRDALADAFGVDAGTVDVIHAPGAGCYGHNGADDAAFEAALLARAHPGRPVRLLWRRADELTRAPLGPAMRSRAEITLADDGSIAAFALEIQSAPHTRRPAGGKPGFAVGPLLAAPLPLPAAAELPPDRGGGADRNAQPAYRGGALRISRRIAWDAPVRTSAMRALGAYANVAAIELAMDAAADAAGSDPVAFRLAVLDDPHARAVIARAAEVSGFHTGTDGERAMGLGYARYKNRAGHCAVVAEVLARETLTVPRLWAVADVGRAIDPDGVIAQVEGGAIQSLSWTLKEAMPLERGAPGAPDWETYPILRFSEIPEIAVELLGDPDDPPLGAGEIAQGPAAAAVATAVRRLFGLDSVAVPLTADNLARQIL